ncbi:MAG: UDP-N-acetylmuramoyl-L-alanine--D-glutamate ligase [Gemmatimonadaceae bacterium]|nr:UDP-N-acetylmuramoyl-L-alanine--D-glutamate ligase [Gemmatimonadaceae bacterium]
MSAERDVLREAHHVLAAADAARGPAIEVARRLSEKTGECAVIGLARSGEAVARLLRSAGLSVYASDASASESTTAAAARLRALGVSADAGAHDLSRIARARFVVVSPGVPPAAPPLVAARAAAVPIVSEVEIALRLAPAMRVIAITGTNGKTTTTALTGHLLRALGAHAVDAGTIGRALSDVVATDPVPAWCALEISSFQLHDTPGLMPTVGVLTTLSPDHLDRYDSVAAYYADKARLFLNADPASHWVLNGDDATILAMAAGVPGTHHTFSLTAASATASYDRRAGQLVLAGAVLAPRAALPLAGDHNVANALAALLAVWAADPAYRTAEARARMAHALGTFHALPHRLEPVGEFGGVLWLNDSKATNVDSTLVAIRSLTRPAVVLLGGRHKGEPYTALREPLARAARAVIAYGEAAPLIARDLEGTVPVTQAGSDFGAVMTLARRAAQPGDAVLLSPACSSYDMFRNYEERGDLFRTLAAGHAA